MSRRQNALLVLMLAAPLTGGTCSFSSSSGGSKIVVTTDDCTPEEERAGECETTPDPPEATLAGTSGRSDASAWSTSMPETMGAIRPAPAVPEPSAALLFLIGAALVAARGPRRSPSDATDLTSVPEPACEAEDGARSPR